MTAFSRKEFAPWRGDLRARAERGVTGDCPRAVSTRKFGASGGCAWEATARFMRVPFYSLVREGD